MTANKTKIPTPEQARELLEPDVLATFESLAGKLVDTFGNPPPGLYLVGWLWLKFYRAKRLGLDSDLVTRMVDESYVEMIAAGPDAKPEDFI